MMTQLRKDIFRTFQSVRDLIVRVVSVNEVEIRGGVGAAIGQAA